MRINFLSETEYFARDLEGGHLTPYVKTARDRGHGIKCPSPHSYSKDRVNNVVSAMPEFKQAFGCHDGQKMVR